jgi:microcystin-dependent protein
MTVKGIGNSGSDVTILPRLRLLSSPYAFLAAGATRLVNVSGNGDLIASASAGAMTINAAVTVNGSLNVGANSLIGTTISGTTISGDGGNLSNLDASKMTQGTLPNARLSGTYGNALTLNNAANSIAGVGTSLTALNGANINSGSIDVAKLAAVVQQALCPPGTIIAYGGDSAPAGWLMCDGTAFYNSSYPNLYAVIGYRFGGNSGSLYFNVPDLRGRFLRGRDAGTGRDPDRASRTAMNPSGATGDAVGSVQDDQLRSHTHQWLGSDGNNSPANTDFTAGEFGSKNQYQNTLATGGNETRPINANVNYIIKY